MDWRRPWALLLVSTRILVIFNSFGFFCPLFHCCRILLPYLLILPGICIIGLCVTVSFSSFCQIRSLKTMILLIYSSCARTQLPSRLLLKQAERSSQELWPKLVCFVITFEHSCSVRILQDRWLTSPRLFPSNQLHCRTRWPRVKRMEVRECSKAR